VHEDELERIASDVNHTLAVANFDALQTLNNELTYVACDSKAILGVTLYSKHPSI